MTLWNRKKMLVLENCFGPIFSPRLTPLYSQAPSSPRCSSTILWEVRPSVPNAKSSLHLLVSSSVILEQVSWHLLPSGVNGYRVILLSGNSFYLEQVTAQCLSPPTLGTLAPTVCLLARRGEAQPAGRMCCEFTVILLLLEQFCSPGTHWHSSFISKHPGLFHVRLIRAQAARLVTNTFFSTCPVLVQSVTSLVINTDHSFTPWSAAASLSDTHISIHISSRLAAVFLLLQLCAYLMHGVFPQAIIAAGKRSPWFG